jgi:very-short-patch-repair endonuclease
MRGRSAAIMNQSGSMNRRIRRDPDAIAFARDQRARANEFAQDAWQMLRNRRCRNQKFRRECPIPPYTVDFCCVALKLIVEIDGEHHQTDDGRQHDQRRDQYLAEQGYEVVRVSGYEVLRDPAVVRRRIEKAIDERIEQRTPSSPALLPHDESEHHSPSSRGRREPK